MAHTNMPTLAIGHWLVKLTSGPTAAKGARATVTFYDSRHPHGVVAEGTRSDGTAFTWKGQKVSSYFLETILIRGDGPLCLHGAYPSEWTVNFSEMKEIIDWLYEVCGELLEQHGNSHSRRQQ